MRAQSRTVNDVESFTCRQNLYTLKDIDENLDFIYTTTNSFSTLGIPFPI
jgi:hypothetical protein